ncbi:MAG: GHKL domain-containing protein [Vampirovibrio sp.]|nr:GHKL domain-containing protein [Vampirovibrio sp.]
MSAPTPTPHEPGAEPPEMVSQRAFLRERAARKQAEDLLEEKSRALYLANEQLEQELAERKQLEVHLIHSEKMASVGQLAAGVAHEINNPVGFVTSNVSTMGEYLRVMKTVLSHYEALTADLKAQLEIGQPDQTDSLHSLRSLQSGLLESITQIEALRQEEDLDFILEDAHQLLAESNEGLRRVKDIVQNLKTFVRLDESDVPKMADINQCLTSSLSVVWNELKYKCQVHKDFGELPPIPCHAGQLNQVFSNLFVNAAQAIEKQGEVRVSTEVDDGFVVIQVTDTGSGIPPEKLSKIFDPFYTTKPVGTGTGLGLSISHGIIEKHKGRIEVDSTVDEGTTFTIYLPITGIQADD